jgi:hypothetical protein
MVNKKQATAKPEEPEGEGVVLEYTPPPPPPKEDGAAKINRRFWDRLKDVTDTTALKGFTRGGGFSGTDINPTWRMERMTEVFGPIGWGWGYQVVKRWTETFGAKQVVFTTVRCWYVPEGEQPYWPKNEEGIPDRREPPINALWTGEQDGGTEVARTPDEVYKQAITDGFGKTCAQIGLASSIYRGKWDDSKYKEDQERFSQMEKVKEYLEALIPELEAMTDTRELRGLRNRASFIANQRTAHEVNFKLGNEFDEIVKSHENRVVHALWKQVRKVLESEDLEVINAEIDVLAPQISALPDDRDIDEIRRLVKERKAALKKAMEPKEEPKQQEESRGQNLEQPPKDQAKEPAAPTLGRFELTYDKGGNPRWGALAKALKETIEGAVAADPRPPLSEVQAFYQAHAKLLEGMKAAEGTPREWAETLIANYKALVAMMED